MRNVAPKCDETAIPAAEFLHLLPYSFLNFPPVLHDHTGSCLFSVLAQAVRASASHFAIFLMCIVSASSGLIVGTMNGVRSIIFCLFLLIISTTFGDRRFLSLTQFNDASCTSVTSVVTFALNGCFRAVLDTFAIVALTKPSFPAGDVNNITQLRLSYYHDAHCHSPASMSDQLQQPMQYFNFPGSDRVSSMDGMKSDTQGQGVGRSCVADSTVSGVYWDVQLRSTSQIPLVKDGGSEYGLLLQVRQLDMTTTLSYLFLTTTIFP